MTGTTPGTACQAGPCTATLIRVIQPCASSTECTFAPDTVCGPPTGIAATLLSAGGISMVCNPAGDGGTTTTEGGTKEDGGTEAGSSGGDSGASDAPTGG